MLARPWLRCVPPATVAFRLLVLNTPPDELAARRLDHPGALTSALARKKSGKNVSDAMNGTSYSMTRRTSNSPICETRRFLLAATLRCRRGAREHESSGLDEIEPGFDQCDVARDPIDARRNIGILRLDQQTSRCLISTRSVFISAIPPRIARRCSRIRSARPSLMAEKLDLRAPPRKGREGNGLWVSPAEVGGGATASSRLARSKPVRRSAAPPLLL